MDVYEAYLLQLPRYGDKGKKALNPGFARVNAMVEAMGHPHARLDCVHVAGTNGKGSTAAMTAAILQSSGLHRVGLYTSPHLVSMRERIRCDGVPVPSAWMNAAVRKYRPVMDTVRPSFFEAVTALAFLYFAERNVSVAVIEAGLGGRLDATNIVTPRLSIVTGIDYDHMNVLGNSLEDIAREKGGIIKQGVPLLTATRQPEALAVLKAIASARSASVHVAQRECTVAAKHHEHGLTLSVTTPETTHATLTVGLAGLHQATNATLAIRAAELAGRAGPAAVRAGLRNVRALSGFRGRLETIALAPRTVVDVAHNPAGLRSALAYARSRCDGRLFVLFGLVRSKDAAKMARALFDSRAIVYTCRVAARRGYSADQLAGILRTWQVPVARAGTWEAAWEHAQARAHAENDLILVCGSHYLAGALLEGLGMINES